MSQDNKPHPRILLVEGNTELRVIPQFLEKNAIHWGEKDDLINWPAKIVASGSVDDMLKPGYIEAELKAPGLKSLGVIVDADGNPAGRWQSIRSRAIKQMPSIPETLPSEGLVMSNESGLKFGVWLMPDCITTGMLETFLATFIREQSTPLWIYSGEMCRQAKATHNAPFKDVHFDKARIHAWLALQNPPGYQLHDAIIKKTLQVDSPAAKPFVSWFRKLFDV